MPKLDLRLTTVATQIRSGLHADIGSDHGHLLVALLRGGRIKRGIAIENKRQPFQNSQHALAGLDAEVRFGDGLAALGKHEADSLSICGMGARTMLHILSTQPDRIPERIVLQPNRRPELIRQWAFRRGFHLISETVAQGHWPYEILSFQRGCGAEDPAYQDVDHRAAMMFGPLTLKKREREFVRQLEAEFEYLIQFKRLSADSSHRLELIRQVIER